MSYCVNCGVELDRTLLQCPLCQTRVVNPAADLTSSELSGSPQQDGLPISTFPQKRGQVEEVKRHDLGLFISIVLSCTAISSLLLNLFVFKGSLWSLLIIGLCVVLFFLVFPAVIYTRTPVYVSLLFDGLSVALYLYFISFITHTNRWFTGLGLPIVGLVTVLVLLFVWLIRLFKGGMLTTGICLITAIALLCIGLELLIDRYLGNDLQLFWSAIVLTVCAVIDSALITVLSRRRLRDAVRKRLHF